MIGVFDSGSGGLTVLQKLRAHFPQKDFIYFADHARCPYGLKSAEEITQATQNACAFLFQKGCAIILLACNTATAVALRDVQQNWLPHTPYAQRRVLGIIAPTVEALLGRPWHELAAESGKEEKGLYAVFATRRTVRSGVYEAELAKRAPRLKLIMQECPLLASALEEGAGSEKVEAYVEEAVEEALEKACGQPFTRAVLGCTHYELVEPLFRKTLPAGTPLLAQGEIVAKSLKDYLACHNEFDESGSGQVQFFTTGDPVLAGSAAEKLIGKKLDYTAADADKP